LLAKAATVLRRFGRIVNDGEGTAASKFVFVKADDDVQMRVHLYCRFNDTIVMRIDANVGSGPRDVEMCKRLWALTEWMPFCSVRFEDRNNDTVSVWLTHSILFEGTRSAGEVEQAIGSISHVWGTAMEIVAESRQPPAAPPVVAEENGDEADDEEDETEDNEDDSDDEENEDMTSMSLNSARRPVAVPARPMSPAQVLAELDKLVGLSPVKDVTRGLVARQRLEKMRLDAGLKAVLPSPHLVFTGNPGTGKTTVARLIGQLYKSLGLLSKGHLIEANRSTLVGGYVGQTALKTRGVCEQAKGGVLFIDEAYSLAGDHVYDYGREAVEELLTFMENNRGKIAVVVAGYPEEMAKFMNMNPGLKSRFDVTIDFPDYSNEDLVEIFNVVARENDYEPRRIQDALGFIIEAMPRGRGFGNGREMRKLFSEILDVHAMRVGRLAHPGARHLRDLAPNDCLPLIKAIRERRRANHGLDDGPARARELAGYL
jgi:SpoVK/Ycf46/Vps4 family AAA+-type ATPase